MSYDIGPKIGIDGEAEFRRAIQGINTTMKTLGTELGMVASAFDKTDKSEAALTARGEVLNKQYDTQKTKLAEMQRGLEAARSKYDDNSEVVQKWQQQVNKAQTELNRLGQALEENERDLTNVRRGYDEAGNKLDEFGRTAQATGDKTEKFKQGITAMQVAVVAAARELGRALTEFVGAGADFEEGMSQVAATMGMSPEEIAAGSEAFETLKQAAKDAGASTKFSATESAEALNYLALAGYDAEKASDALPAVLNLAAAGGLDLAYASDLATDAMAALGIEASQESLTEFGDKMARTASKANTSVAQLGEATLTVGGTAKGLAGGVTELNTSLGVLANRGIKGAEGGTALRNIILSLSAPTDKAAKQMKALGLEVYDASGNLRPLNEVFKDLDSSMAQMTEGEKTAALNEMFNKVDLKSVQAMLAGCGEEFDTLAAAVSDSGGAMQDMADVQIDNLKGAVTIMKSSIGGFGIAVYEGIGGPLKQAAQTATQYVGQLTQAFEAGGFQGLVDEAGNILGQVMEGMVSALPDVLDGARQIVLALVNGITNALPTLIPTAVDAVLTIADGLLDNIDQIVDAGIDLVFALADGLISALPRLVEKAPEIVGKLVSAIVTNAPKLLEAAGELIVKLVEGIKSGLSNLGHAAGEIVATVVMGIGNLWNDLKEAGNNIVTGIWEGIKGMGAWLMEQVKGFFSGVVDGVKNFLGIHSPSTVFAELGGFTVEGFALGMENKKGKAIKTAEELSEAIYDAASGWVKDKKALDQLTIGEEADFWEALKEVGGLGAEELKEIDQNLYKARKQEAKEAADASAKASKDAYTYSKKWIDNEKFYHRLSAQEEVEAWERVVERHNLLADEQAEAEKNLYTARQNLMKEEQAAEQKIYDEQKKAFDEYEKAVQSRAKSLEGFAGLFDSVEKKNDVSGRELLKNLRDQVKAFEGWQADMEALAGRGITGPLLDELRDMGPKAADELHALLQLSDKQLDEYAELFAKKGQLAAEQAEREIPAVEVPVELGALAEEQLAQVGQTIASALAGTGEAQTAGEETAGAFAQGVAGQAERTQAAGAGVMTETVRGFQAALAQLTGAAGESVEAVCATFSASAGKFQRAGRDAMAGLRFGLESEGRRAIATARSIADAIVAEMRRALDIHSPSRKMAELVGVPTAQGIMVGFESEMANVKRQMRRSADEVMGSLPVTGGGNTSADLVSGLVNALAPLMERGGGGQNVTLNINLDGKQIASVVYDPLVDEGRRRGGKALVPA